MVVVRVAGTIACGILPRLGFQGVPSSPYAEGWGPHTLLDTEPRKTELVLNLDK